MRNLAKLLVRQWHIIAIAACIMLFLAMQGKSADAATCHLYKNGVGSYSYTYVSGKRTETKYSDRSCASPITGNPTTKKPVTVLSTVDPNPKQGDSVVHGKRPPIEVYQDDRRETLVSTTYNTYNTSYNTYVLSNDKGWTDIGGVMVNSEWNIVLLPSGAVIVNGVYYPAQ